MNNWSLAPFHRFVMFRLILFFCPLLLLPPGLPPVFRLEVILAPLGPGPSSSKTKKKTSETGSFDGSWVVSFGLSTSTALSKWSQVESQTEMVMHGVTAGVYLWNLDSSLQSHLKQNETKHRNWRIKSDRSLSICPSFVLACFNCLVCPSGFFMCFLTSGIAGCALDFAPCHLGTDEHSMKHSRSCRASHKGYWKCQPMEIRRVQMSQWSSTMRVQKGQLLATFSERVFLGWFLRIVITYWSYWSRLHHYATISTMHF